MATQKFQFSYTSTVSHNICDLNACVNAWMIVVLSSWLLHTFVVDLWRLVAIFEFVIVICMKIQLGNTIHNIITIRHATEHTRGLWNLETYKSRPGVVHSLRAAYTCIIDFCQTWLKLIKLITHPNLLPSIHWHITALARCQNYSHVLPVEHTMFRGVGKGVLRVLEHPLISSYTYPLDPWLASSNWL